MLTRCNVKNIVNKKSHLTYVLLDARYHKSIGVFRGEHHFDDLA